MPSRLRGDRIDVPNNASDPSSPVEGQIHYNTTNDTLRVYSNGAWTDVSPTPPSFNTAAGSLGQAFTTSSPTFDVGVSEGDSYSILLGSLPSGLSLSAIGGGVRISGTVAAGAAADFSSNTSNFTIQASNGAGSENRAFSIGIVSRYVGRECRTGNEGASLSDTAPAPYYFVRKDFSSYGNPNGSCGSFGFGGCNAGGSSSYNPTPTQSYSVGANNGRWGDPCGGVGKRMYIQMSYGPLNV